MKILADENIAFASEAFSKFGDVTLMNGRKINNASLKHCDILIVRSITKVDENLLNGTRVKFVGTATIGTDHIDFEYLKENNISFADAKGCNSHAVAEYVFTALLKTAVEKNIELKDKVMGVVGVGNIGSKIVKLSKALGMKILMNDPPLKRLTKNNDFVPLEQIYDADIITLHVPLNLKGIDRTVHLFDSNNLNKLKGNTILINASRGQVIDNFALNKIILQKNLTGILDVWENEPNINLELLQKVFIGTSHIAGYSLEGKVNGTVMMANAITKFLNNKSKWVPDLPAVDKQYYELDENDKLEKTLFNLFNHIYPINEDNARLKNILKIKEHERAEYFDTLRKNYPLRREFNNFTVKLNHAPHFQNEKPINILKAFRFQIRKN